MKDIIIILFLYIIWNTEIHTKHPVLLPVLLTLCIVIWIIELIDAIINNN